MDGISLALLKGVINKQAPPKDSDPSDMTDFEKNTTQGEFEQVEGTEPPGRVDQPEDRQKQNDAKDRDEGEPQVGKLETP